MGKYRIMVVEDSPTMKSLIVFALKGLEEVEIIEASDGMDALKKLPEQKIDLVLTDINMPIMEGLKLITLMRQNSSFKEIPIIIITTEGREEDRERGMALGATSYLPKPIRTYQLIEVVKEIRQKQST